MMTLMDIFSLYEESAYQTIFGALYNSTGEVKKCRISCYCMFYYS